MEFCLPDDCLTFIFKKLDSSTDRDSFGLTCHRFLQIQNPNRKSLEFGCSFSRSNLSETTINIDSFILDKLIKRFTNLNSLNLCGCVNLQDSGLIQLTNHAQNYTLYTSIAVSKSQIQDFPITGILSGGGLEYLNVSCLSWCIYGDGLRSIGGGFGKNIRVLDFRVCRSVDDETVIEISKGCPVLQEWNLSLCSEIGVLGWEAIGGYCRNLEKLHVNGCRGFCDRGLMGLRNGCRKLLILYVSRCRKVSELGIELFKVARGDVEIKAEEVMCIMPKHFFR